MSVFIKTLSSTLVVILFAQSASAGNLKDSSKFTATLKYDVTTSAEDSYSSLKQQVNKICKKQTRAIKGIGAVLDYRKSCHDELMDQAILQIQSNDLFQLHVTEAQPEGRRLEVLKKSKPSNPYQKS